MWTAEGQGEPVRVYRAFTDFDEANFIVDEIKTLHADGIALSQIALLYRSNAQSRVLEHSLFNASLSYRVYGGMRFFERMEVKHALAYLRLIANPEDDNALLRIINFPTRGIGARSLEQLQDNARKQNISLWAAALQKCGGEAEIAINTSDHGENKKGVAGFVQLVHTMRQNWEDLPLPQIIERILLHSGLIAHYKAEKEGADRLENLHELINAGISFVHEADDDSLMAFLSHASLEAGDHQAGSGEDALQLMTVHAAKGLEFHTVFLSGLEEGLFPHENSLSTTHGLEEERRLMYVAMTRARRRLYLSLAQSRMLHGQTRYNTASRFVDEIPEKFLKWINLPVDADISQHRSSCSIDSVATVATNGRQPKTSKQSAQAIGQWYIGQTVMHAKFGEGVILDYEGNGSDARVQVRFNHVGTKWLMLEYAKLTPC